ncbi:MAG TPA: aldo/keto reductase [Lacisediminihabitans sp.]|uniref:aldo/keto reductase n=1 Tax=Lacisediminihabitans sp. TaxID=2787631 RepID=UPI002ED960CF
MRQVELGTTGIAVSEMFFGAGSIGGIGSSPATRGLGMATDEALERLDEAYEVGLRVIDTANTYAGGESERIVGRWHQERELTDVLLSTKVGNVAEPGQDGISLRADHIERQLALSRSRLGRVDLYLSHAPDDRTPLEETLTAFAAAVDAGQIRAFGCSNVDVRGLEALLTAADRVGLPRPGWVQNEFSLVARADERDLLPLAAGEGIGYTGYSPLAGGLLSDRYLDPEVEAPADSRLGIAPAMYADAVTDENRLRVGRLADLARDLDVSTSGLALAWLRWHPLLTAPIVSPRRTEQWDAVTEALALDLDDELAERIGSLFD